MPIENVIDRAKANNSNPLNFANSSVLNPINKKIAKITSAAVATPPNMGIIKSGIHGFIIAVYSTKLSQLPQAETSLDHIPNLSATADKNPMERANRKNNFIVLANIIVVFTALGLGFV